MIRLFHDKIVVSVPYNPAFIAEVKWMFSPRERRWDSRARLWVFPFGERSDRDLVFWAVYGLVDRIFGR
jgi:hypothetical protein